MGSPVDVSYLADNVLLFRYFESQGAVRQAISVVKRRSGPHERSIRELRFSTNKIEVGASLHEFEGILTGVPRFVGDSNPLL
jgi:circadian clock protein KaiC